MKKDRKYFNEKFKILNNKNSNTRKIIDVRALELGVRKDER